MVFNRNAHFIAYGPVAKIIDCNDLPNEKAIFLVQGLDCQAVFVVVEQTSVQVISPLAQRQGIHRACRSAAPIIILHEDLFESRFISNQGADVHLGWIIPATKAHIAIVNWNRPGRRAQNDRRIGLAARVIDTAIGPGRVVALPNLSRTVISHSSSPSRPFRERSARSCSLWSIFSTKRSFSFLVMPA